MRKLIEWKIIKNCERKFSFGFVCMGVVVWVQPQCRSRFHRYQIYFQLEFLLRNLKKPIWWKGWICKQFKAANWSQGWERKLIKYLIKNFWFVKMFSTLKRMTRTKHPTGKVFITSLFYLLFTSTLKMISLISVSSQ